MIYFDVETTGLQPDYHHAFMYQFADDASEVHVLTPGEDDERIQLWFDQAAVEGLMAHNSKFDIAFAEAAGFKLPPEEMWHDSMLIAHAIDERRSVALKSVALGLFGPDADDLQLDVKAWLTAERGRRKTAAREAGQELIEPDYSDVPNALMREYAAEDVVLTRKVNKVYRPILAKAPEIANIVEFEREVMGALYAMERRGFPADVSAYRGLEHELIESLEEIEENIQSLAQVPEGEEFNPASSPQLYAALDRLGADLSFVTNQSMDKENLYTVDHPLARAVETFRSEYKVLGTYVQPMISRSYDTSMRSWKEPFVTPDGRIHANYRQVGARTGRMSCSAPNLQNQPRDDLRLRYNLRADPGMKLVTCDLSNIEMRVFAAYTGEGKLLDAMREGRDVYTDVAENLGIRDRERAGGHVETARQRAKMFALSVIYGGGLRTIRKQQRCDMNQARMLQRRFYEAYPEASRLQDRILWKLEDRGYVTSAWGRRFRSDNPDREGYKFTNYIVQGTAADLLKASLVRVHREGIPIVACVHDELLCHVPEADAEEAKDKMIEALTDHPRISDKVPLTAEGDIVDRWSQAKDPDFVPRWARDA